jgi:hypothetical protein
MRNSFNPSKLIVAIAQLLLLGACGSPAANESNLPAPLSDRRDTDKTQKELSDKLAKQEGITFKLRQDFDELRQDLDTFKIVFALSFLVLLPAVGLASYFFAIKPRSSAENTRLRKRSKELDPSSASVSQEPNQNKSSGLGFGSANKLVSPSQSLESPLDHIQSTSEPNQYKKPDFQNTRDKYSSTPNISRDTGILRRSQSNQSVTYDIAVQFYQNRKYDLLEPYSQGYFSATPESMTRNRAYQENPLELVQSYDGLFWIIKTVDSHCLLFPNPEKRIEQTRILGIEYFFNTNFNHENFLSVIVVDPAYMGYENGKWVMRQKGQIDFGY